MAKGAHRRKVAKGECSPHRYGPARPIGGGILRRTCRACGAVSIDLTAAESGLGTPAPNLATPIETKR